MEHILRDILQELQLLNRRVDDIAEKLPFTAPLYTIDDIHAKIEDAARDITGPTGYHIGDLHEQLVALESAVDLK